MTIHVNIDGELYTIEASGHAGQRMDERFSENYMNSEFVVHRLATLLEKPEFVDVILNGVRYGECFILEDFEMGFDMAVRHVMDGSGCHLVILTIRRYLCRGIGEKIVRIQGGRVVPYLFRSKEVWAY